MKLEQKDDCVIKDVIGNQGILVIQEWWKRWYLNEYEMVAKGGISVVIENGGKRWKMAGKGRIRKR